MSDRSRVRRPPTTPPVPPSPGPAESGEPPPLSIEQARLLPFYHDLRNEIVQPDKIVVTSQYFWTRWAPRLGPTLTALLVCLRRHCYYNRITQERRDWCFPEQATLAREIGVETTKTIRAALSHPLAAYFVRREARYVYDPNRGKKVRTSDMYFVAMDDPLTPEDEALLALRAAERLMQEGRGAELALDAPVGASAAPSAPRSAPRAKARRPRQPDPTGQNDRQDPPNRTPTPTGTIDPEVPDRQFFPQDSAVISGPEVVPEESTNTTKYSTLLSPLVEAFAAANGATPTPAQVARLGALAAQFDPAARQGGPGRSGADWVLAAIREAVESGSRFVAPRRIARICERWAAEGPPEEVGGVRLSPGTAGSLSPYPLLQCAGEGESQARQLRTSWLGCADRHLPTSSLSTILPVSSPPPRTGGGGRGRGTPGAPRKGDASVDEAPSAAAPPDPLAEQAVTAVASGLFRCDEGIPDPGDTASGQRGERDLGRPPDDRAASSFVVFPELGLLSRPLWRAICDDARSRLASPGDRQLLEGSQLLAREESTLVVGVPGQAAARRAEARLVRPLAAITRAILGREVALRFVSLGDWGISGGGGPGT